MLIKFLRPCYKHFNPFMHSVAVWQHEALFVQKEIMHERVNESRSIFKSNLASFK